MLSVSPMMACGSGNAVGDAGTDPDADTGADASGDVGRDPDGHVSDAETDAEDDCVPEPSPCPGHDDMVLITSLDVCIDRYEASQGPGDVAESVAGVMPWTEVAWSQATWACTAAGKRLCDTSEWVAACNGPCDWDFSFGNDARGETCPCNGGGYGLHEVVPTGSMTGCEGGYPGIFDLSGNVAEWTTICDADDLCQVRGGAYGEGMYDLVCEYFSDMYIRWARMTIQSPHIGFRCCLTL
jgi:hypothetical protein